MFEWFTNLFKSADTNTSFSKTDTASVKDVTAPKVADYPRSKYSVYWEIIKDESPEHGYKATLRLNSYMGGVVDEIVFVSRYPEDLRNQVYRAIPGKMQKHRKEQ